MVNAHNMISIIGHLHVNWLKHGLCHTFWGKMIFIGHLPVKWLKTWDMSYILGENEVITSVLYMIDIYLYFFLNFSKYFLSTLFFVVL